MADSESAKYRAPALEKGLDILMVLARESRSLTMSQLSERLGRSKGEIFRMIQVLEERNFIARSPGEEGYAITNMLFALGMEQPPMRGLLEVSLPAMHDLADSLWQSCHLVVAAGDKMVVVARVDSPGEIGFAVRLGHHRPLFNSTSGRVLYAFQPTSIRERWTRVLQQLHLDFDPDALERSASEILARGHAEDASSAVRGVTDLSAPILQADMAVAALTVPYVERTVSITSRAEAVRALKATADTISRSLQVGSTSARRLSSKRRGDPVHI